jgi:hypothetical protein
MRPDSGSEIAVYTATMPYAEDKDIASMCCKLVKLLEFGANLAEEKNGASGAVFWR